MIWVDWETYGPWSVAQAGRIPAGENASFQGLPYPWCSNSLEVETKAFGFYRDIWPTEEIPPWTFGDPTHEDWIQGHLGGQEALVYVFQKYQDDEVYYSIPDGVNNVAWSGIQWCGEGPSANQDLYVADGPMRVSARAVNV